MIKSFSKDAAKRKARNTTCCNNRNICSTLANYLESFNVFIGLFRTQTNIYSVEHFYKNSKRLKLLTVFIKNSIIDAYLGSKFAYVFIWKYLITLTRV